MTAPRPLTSVHVDTGRTWRGGQAQVLHLVRGLRSRGQTVLLVAPPGSPLAVRARALELPLATLALRGEWDLGSALGLARLLRHTRTDVVHAHTAHAVTITGLAAALAGRVAASEAWRAPESSASEPARHRPLRVAARRVDFPVGASGRLKLRWLADVVVAVSAGVRDVLHASGVPAARIEIVRSGVEPAGAGTVAAGDAASFREELGVGTAPLVGAVGALVGHKDHGTFAAAAARIARVRPDVHFVLAGAGELEGEIRAQVARLGLASTFHMVGFRTDVGAVLAALDVFVLSSALEGLGTSVLDAMAAGVPVVATRAGGVPEMIDDAKTGLLVPPRDPEALAAAVLRLLADPALAWDLAARARAGLGERFSAARMVEETDALYRRWLARPTDASARD